MMTSYWLSEGTPATMPSIRSYSGLPSTHDCLSFSTSGPVVAASLAHSADGSSPAPWASV